MSKIKKQITDALTDTENQLKSMKDELKGYPRGALVKKIINGSEYYYEVRRIGGKQTYIYLGPSSERFLEIRNRKKTLKQRIKELGKDIHKLKRCVKILN